MTTRYSHDATFRAMGQPGTGPLGRSSGGPLRLLAYVLLPGAVLLGAGRPLGAQESPARPAMASSRPDDGSAGETGWLTSDAVELRAATASPATWMGREESSALRVIAADLAAHRREQALERWEEFVSRAARAGHLRSAEEARPLFDLAVRWAFLDSDPELKPLADRVRRAEELRQVAQAKLRRASLRARESRGAVGVGAGEVRTPIADAGERRQAARLDVQAAELEVAAAERRYRAAVLRLREAISLRGARAEGLANMATAAHDAAMNAIRNVRA